MPKFYRGKNSLSGKDKKHALALIKSGQAPTPKALIELMPNVSHQAIGGLFTAESRRARGLDPLTGKIPQQSPIPDLPSGAVPPDPLPVIPPPAGGNGNGSGKPVTSPETAAAAAAISDVPQVSALPAASSVPVSSIAPPPAPGRIAIWRSYGDPTGFLGEEPAPLDIPKIKEKYGGGTYDFIIQRPNTVPVHQKSIVIAGASKPPPPVEPSSVFRERSLLHRPEGLAPAGDASLLSAFKTFQEISQAAEQRARDVLKDGPDKKVEADGSIAKNAFDLVKGAMDRTGKDDGAMAALLKYQSEERSAAAERHKQDLERMRQQADLERTRDERRAELEMQRERERAANEIAREKERLDRREAQDKTFFAEMQKIRESQAELVRKELELQRSSMIKELQEARAQAAAEHESIMGMAAEKKKEWDEFRTREMKHLEEVLVLKSSMGSGAHEIEVQKMWMNTVTDVFARVERKVEMLATAGQQNRIPYTPPGVSSAPPALPGKELSVSMADAIFKSQIFNDSVRGEIDLHISSRNPAELFVDAILAMKSMDQRVAIFISYFFGRTWKMILADAQTRLPSSSLRIWNTQHAEQWFNDVRNTYFGYIQQSRMALAQTAPAAAPVVDVPEASEPEPEPEPQVPEPAPAAAPAPAPAPAPAQAAAPPPAAPAQPG